MNKEEKAKLWADRIQQYKTSGQTCKQWCAENDIPLWEKAGRNDMYRLVTLQF